VIEFVRERDRPCPLCGYNLRNLTTARCPECGHRLRLLVQPEHVHFGPWVTAIAALTGSAAIGLLFVWLALLRGIQRLLSDLRGTEGKVVLFWCILAIPLAAIVLALRRRFVRMSRAMQWSLSAPAAIMLIVALILFYRSMR
jgi:hypothetical protein